MIELEVGQKWRSESTNEICRITSISRRLGTVTLRDVVTWKYFTLNLDYATKRFNDECVLLTKYTNAPKETIVSPNHYIGDNGLEVETVLQNFVPRYDNSYISHRVASSMEYLLRAPLKNGLEDLKKARRNLDQAIEYYENNRLTKL